MIKVERKLICDLCGKEGAKTFHTLAEFETEQNEGKPVKLYITSTEIELCEECLKKVVLLKASGAQGNNRFWISK